jgi:hypothetical protein
LKADRQGLVIVNPKLAYSNLHNVRRVSFADQQLAEQFEKWVRTPEPTVEIFIEKGISS